MKIWYLIYTTVVKFWIAPTLKEKKKKKSLVKRKNYIIYNLRLLDMEIYVLAVL